MKILLLIITAAAFSFQSSGQTREPVRSLDELMPDGVFSQVPDEMRHRKPYLRYRWFYEQRAYPFDYIPEDAYKRSLEQRDELRRNQGQRNIPEFEWVNIGPTPGYYFNYGNISSRVVTGAYHPTNPNIIYIGPANGGVWKSTNGGTSWIPTSDYENSLSMGSIAVDPVNPDIIYAGTGEATYSIVSYYGRGLLKSTNAGATWTNITTGLPTSTYFSRLKIRPNNNTQLLAALGSSGLYRSTNSGANWFQVLSGRVDDVVFSPTGDTAFAAGSGIGIRRSINGGASFSTYGATGLGSGSRTNFDLAQSNTSVMWAAVYSSGAVTVYKSTDYGVNWSTVTMSTGFNDQGGQAWYDLYCLINPKNHNNVYIGTIDIYRTTNGSTFSNITNGYAGGNVHVDQHYLLFHPTDANTIISCNDGGVWKSTNSGTSFTNLNQSLTLTQFYRIAASPFTPSRVLGGTQDNGTQQTYSTINWAAAYGGDGGEVCFNPFNSNFILGETQNNGVFRTTNGGTTWSSATSGLSSTENRAWVAPIIHHPSVSGTFYTARQRIYKTTNNAGSWTAISDNVNGTNAVRELAQSKTNPDIMFATTGSQVFKSTNEGVNWSNVTTGLPARTITSVYVHPEDANQVFLTFSGFSTNKIYKSTNSGSTWASIHGNLPDSPVNDLLIFTENTSSANTYFAATDIGVFVTVDNGLNWVEIPGSLPNTVIMHLDYSPSVKMLRAGTHGRGVYEAYVDFTVPTTFQIAVTVEDGWNMVSIPGLHPVDQNVTTWWQYRDPAAAVFRYFNYIGYQIVNDAAPGEGYYMKHLGPRVYNTGDEWPAGGILFVPHDPITAYSGWNMIGGYEASVPTSGLTTTPPGLINGQVYGYSDGYYVANNLVPGYGYWVQLNGQGMINIPDALAKVATDADEFFRKDWGRIILSDISGRSYTLYAVKGEINLNRYELPPVPPAGMFDIRFSSGRIAEDITSSSQTIEMSGIKYPVTVRAENISLRLQDEAGKEININLMTGEEITFSNINKLFVSGDFIPDKYSLEQNYPNPFNPGTTIKFSIPKETQVNLSVFNLLGEKVNELKDEVMMPGYYEVGFDASELASGIYFYRLTAGDPSIGSGFVQSKKMLLMK